ncbi:lipopolysaccharide assembly protein LapB [Dyadobacter sp. NIV53]|uniref:tetratricopeptide repeat protein n=1 Tax=Dyadobacter sp. NIV53 TaxID=2861765 RepID=UPI001C868262|nr:tetratricopeptide repeat protein [Dyadobacter sp. NIV53]
MKVNRILYPIFYSLIILATTCILQSCQSDARNNTRIPPVIKNTKAKLEKDALLSLTELINRNIDQNSNYFKRARIYFDKEQFKQALADINEAIEEQENVGEYFLLRGKINREIGEMDLALEDAERAEALQQNSPELYVLLADILQVKGKFREAGKYLNQAMQMAPYDGSAYYVKGMLEARQGDSLSSLTSLSYAMNVNPRLLRAYLQSTIINRKLLNYDQALVINDMAIKRFPNMPELYFEKGELYNVLAKPDTAIIYYQKAVSLNPKYTEALYQMATYEIKQRYYYKALVSLQQLQKVKPDYPLINNMIGLCYEKTGDYPRAREYYTVALNMNDADRDAHNGLWRIRVRETNPSYYSGESDERQYKLLDTARVKIDLIQPRKSINMQVDSSRKAKIQ